MLLNTDKFGNSTVWDDQFPADEEALGEAKATIAMIKDEDIASPISAPS